MSTKTQIQLIQNTEQLPKQKGRSITLCDPEASDFMLAELRVTRDVTLGTLLDRSRDYRDSLNELPTTGNKFKELGIRAANFPVSDIMKIINQYGNRTQFIRVYVGKVLVDDGDNKNHLEHQLFIAPVDVDKKLIQDAGTIYSAQCCGYPPHKENFLGDPILGI
jgi:hypothetical protein